MKISHLVQGPASSEDDTVGGCLKRYVHEGPYDRVRVAMAYVTVSGVRILLEMFENRSIRRSEWVIGLDDAISQPGAIALVRELQHARVSGILCL